MGITAEELKEKVGNAENVAKKNLPHPLPTNINEEAKYCVK